MTFREYHQETAIELGVVEELTGSEQTQVSASTPLPLMASWITKARQDIAHRIHIIDRDVIIREEIITFPAGLQQLRMHPPNGVLEFNPKSIEVILDPKENGEYMVRGTTPRQRARYQATRGLSRFTSIVYELIGPDLVVYGVFSSDRQLKIRYSPVPETVTATMLEDDLDDDLIPSDYQRHVSVRAAIRGARTLQMRHTELEATWAEAKKEIKQTALLHDGGRPRRVRRVGPRHLNRRWL